MNEQKTTKMKIKKNETKEKKNKNETKENKIDVDIDIDIDDDIISTYIIPYNESYDYVFISELFRQEHIKPYLENIKKLSVKKHWIKHTLLDDYKYAIQFSCNKNIIKYVKNELILRQLWIKQVSDHMETQLVKNTYFN